MADMTQEQKDVNIQEVVAESSPAETQANAPITPTAEDAGAAKPENKVPQSRFNEVIEQRNADRIARERLEARVRELESVKPESGPRKSVADIEVDRLVKELGMEESAARSIVRTYENLTNAQRQEQVRTQNRHRAEEWATQKAEKDPVYKELEPELDKSFSFLEPEMQGFIAQNPHALEMFYESVKSKHLAGKSKDAYSKGADDAYKNKAAKQAIASVPGASSSVGKTQLTRDSLLKMSNSEYQKRLPEINEAIKNGTLK